MWVALPAIVVAAGAIVVIILLDRARRRDRLAAARWAMISRVSALLAEILHADTTLEDVARLLVPQFADWCTLHLVEESAIRRAAVVHADPDIERRLRGRFAEVPFVADATPLGRWGGESEIAKAVLGFIEQDFVTGETFRVDGGRHVK